MFDTHIHRQAAPYPQRVNITEQRAPTDESVRLMREMQVEAEKHRIGAFHLEGNNLTGVVEIYQVFDPPAVAAKVIFDLNGKRHTVDVRTNFYDRDAKEKLIQEAHKAVAEKIATEALIGMLAGVRWPR